MNQKTLAKLSGFFAGQKEVVAVYLYGSRAERREIKTSDLDLAVLFTRKATNPRQVLEMGVEVQKLLGNVFQVDLREIHLGLSPIFLGEVISKGKIIFCRDEEMRVEFEVAAMRIIDDSQEIERINRYYLKKSFKEGTYGRAA